MLDQFKRLGKHSAIYGISGILNLAISFVLLPLYANYLEPEVYGILSILTITASFVATFFQLGTGTAVFRSVVQKDVDKSIVLSTAFYFTLGLIVIGLFFFVYIAYQFDELIFNDVSNNYPGLLSVVILTAAFDSITAVPLAKLRIEEQSLKFTVLSGLNFIVGLILNIIFVVVLGFGLWGILTANIIRSILYASTMTIILFPDLKWIFSPLELNELLRFGLPIVPISVAALILASSDRYFLRFYTSYAEVGVYSLGYKIGSVIQLPIAAFQVAWPTILFSVSKTVHAQQFYARVLTYYFLFIGYLVFVLSLFAREIVIVLSEPGYIEAWKIVPPIAVSQLSFGVLFVTAVGVNLKRKPEYIMYAWLIGVIVHLFLNIVLISRFGIYGAAVSTLVSYIIVAGSSTFASLKLYFVPYQISRIGKLGLVFGIAYLVSISVSTQAALYFQSVLLKVIITLTIPILLWVIGFFTSEEITIIRSLFRSLIIPHAE